MPDDVHAPGAVQLRFRAGREVRALDADVGAARVEGGARLAARLRQPRARGRRRRGGRRPRGPPARGRRTSTAAAWCGPRTGRGPRCAGARIFSLSEPTAETERMRSTPSIFSAKMLAWKLSSLGQERWPRRVAGQEGHAPALQQAQHEAVGGRAEGRLHRHLADVGEALHLVEAAAADDARCPRDLRSCSSRRSGRTLLPIVPTDRSSGVERPSLRRGHTAPNALARGSSDERAAAVDAGLVRAHVLGGHPHAQRRPELPGRQRRSPPRGRGGRPHPGPGPRARDRGAAGRGSASRTWWASP